MCTLFHQLCFEAVFGSIDAQGLKVDIEPVKGVAFDILVLHLEVYLSVVITGKVDNNTAIFLFEQIAQVAGILLNTASRPEQQLHLPEKIRQILQFSDNAGTVHQH